MVYGWSLQNLKKKMLLIAILFGDTPILLGIVM